VGELVVGKPRQCTSRWREGQEQRLSALECLLDAMSDVGDSTRLDDAQDAGEDTRCFLRTVHIDE
jgi:hypothetical protein